jgi:hypothetical protein
MIEDRRAVIRQMLVVPDSSPQPCNVQDILPAFTFADCLTQCFRRAFPEHFTVFNLKTPEFNKAKTGCDFGDG